jgi:hypothetical protein
MKFYGIDMQGSFQIETVTSLPTFTASRDTRRVLYYNNLLYYGTATR